MDIIKKFQKPLTNKTRRNIRRVKTALIIILSAIVIGEFIVRRNSERLYEERISEYKDLTQSIMKELSLVREELVLIRNAVPIDIEKMGKITNAIMSIQDITPNMELPTAEYYANIIINESEKYDNVNANMLISLIRQESNFSPTAVSWAGAMGLGQVMPATGRWIIEDKWNLPYSDSLLFDPFVNTKVTAWYLSYLLANNDNNFKVALANYNGGGWQAKRYKLLLKSKSGIKLNTEEINQLNKMPEETIEYVPSVFSYYTQINKLHIEKMTKED